MEDRVIKATRLMEAALPLIAEAYDSAQPDVEYVIVFDLSDDCVFAVAKGVSDCSGRPLVTKDTRRVGRSGEPFVCCMGFDRHSAERIVAQFGVEFPWRESVRWRFALPVLFLTGGQVMPLTIAREPVVE